MKKINTILQSENLIKNCKRKLSIFSKLLKFGIGPFSNDGRLAPKQSTKDKLSNCKIYLKKIVD